MYRLTLKELYLGKIDAYNEYLEYGAEIFQNTFFEYPNFDLESVLNGKIYYICGDKGTGKTMLLKYAESKALKDPTVNFSQFIRFKKEIDEEQRQQIKKTSTTEDQVIDGNIPENQNIDCILAWKVFLIKTIITRIQKTESGVFERNSEQFKKLFSIISTIYDEPESIGWIKKILPKIKHGKIQIAPTNYTTLNIDLEWEDHKKEGISFSSIAKRIVNLYTELLPSKKGRLYIFIDELELTLKRTEQYTRDVSLIRDLIFAIQDLNEIARTNKYSTYIITAIRNEVHKEIQSKGMEINKPIMDFGTQISWRQNGGDIKNNPLLKMIEKRIIYSETKRKIKPTENIWEKYFVREITTLKTGEKISIHNYLLDQTWNKPRDIIRLFSIIKQKHASNNFINQAVLDSVRQSYAQEAWEEFAEEMTAKYTTHQIAGIQHVLMGMKTPFTFHEFSEKISETRKFFEEVKALDTIESSYILRHLYDLGIIGNGGQYPRFSFKGEPDINPYGSIIFHYPLIRFFKTSNKRNN